MLRSTPAAGRLRRLTTGLVVVGALGAALPAAASAADPSNVNFTLEGCRLPEGQTLPIDGRFVCADGDYTTGNLGKRYNELDLVPHRLTADNNNGAQTYSVTIAADHRAGTLGYDVISTPVLDEARSTDGGCSITASDQTVLGDDAGEDAVGGADQSIYRLLTITQAAGAVCVFDYYQRLGLGAAAFSGSSLQSYLLNEELTASGIGQRRLSLPVNEILPQGLSKTMTATSGTSTSWNVTKSVTPRDVRFETCGGSADATARSVTVTVSWQKVALASGTVTLISNITIDNPASRSITATVSDRMYEGTSQTTPVGAPYSSGPVVVAANSTRTVTNTQLVTDATPADVYNDVATATYSDVVTGVPIVGQTQATAQARLRTINQPNDSATISDAEAITGDGLTFSLDSTAPAGELGDVEGGRYVAGTRVTSLDWSRTVTGSGSAEFRKTIHVTPGLTTSGALSDTATLVDRQGNTQTASASTTISARGCITGTKFHDLDADGTRDGGEPLLGGVRIYVDADDDGTLDPGEPTAVTDDQGRYSIGTGTLADGTYDVREVVPSGAVCTAPAGCVHRVVVGPGPVDAGNDFGNAFLARVSGTKFGDLDGDGARDPGEGGVGGVRFFADTDGDGALDAGEPSALSAGDGTWTIAGIRPGRVTIREVVPEGSTCTTPVPCSVVVTLGSGQAVTGLVFGNTPPPPPTTTSTTTTTTTTSPAPTPGPAPQQGVLGTVAQSPTRGSARLDASAPCRPTFTVTVSGRRISRVRFSVDGRVVRTLRRPNAGSRYRLRLTPARYSRRTHTVTARIDFAAGSRTRSVTRSADFQRCARTARPVFTG